MSGQLRRAPKMSGSGGQKKSALQVCLRSGQMQIAEQFRGEDILKQTDVNISRALGFTPEVSPKPLELEVGVCQDVS